MPCRCVRGSRAAVLCFRAAVLLQVDKTHRDPACHHAMLAEPMNKAYLPDGSVCLRLGLLAALKCTAKSLSLMAAHTLQTWPLRFA